MICKRNSPDQIDASIGCVRETPQRKIKEHGMFKRDSPDKNENNMGCVRETSQINIKPAETPKVKLTQAWDL